MVNYTKKLKEEEKKGVTEREPEKAPSKIKQPEAAQKPAAPQIPITPQPQVIRDQETGKITGVKLPTGQTYLGKEKDILPLVQARTPAPLPTGALEASQQAQLLSEQERRAELVSQVGAITPTQAQAAQPSYEQALKSGLAQAGAGAIGGAAIGAIAGGGVGAIPLAVVGAIGGFLNGIRSNLKSQKGGEIRAATISIREGEQNLRALVTDMNRNPQNAVEDLTLFNAQLTRMEQSHSVLKLETSADLSKWLGEDGTPELRRYEEFYAAGGARDLLIREMQTALINPNPNKNFVTLDDLGLTEEI